MAGHFNGLNAHTAWGGIPKHRLIGALNLNVSQSIVKKLEIFPERKQINKFCRQ